MTDEQNPVDPQDPAAEAPQAGGATPQAGGAPPQAGEAGAKGSGGIADAMAEMIANAEPSPSEMATPSAEPASYEELNGGTWADPGALSMLYDLTMPVAIELGRTRMSVQEILAIGRGSVIQLDRLAGEPIDVFVGDRRFAEGEVVVVGEQFGVRITRILNPSARLEEPEEAVA